MKKNFLIPTAFLFMITACNKSVDKQVGNTTENTTGLLSRMIVLSPTDDSLITNYTYDDSNYLIKESEDTFRATDGTVQYLNDIWEYTRDEKERVIKAIHTSDGDTDEILNVHYNNANEIAYIIDHSTHYYYPSGSSTTIDSLTYEYSNHRVKRINTFHLQPIQLVQQPNYYETFEYAGPDVSQIRSFILNDDGTYREGDRYDFEYDDKINPFFKPGDSFFFRNGNYFSNLSANNITKQTVTYDTTTPTFPPALTYDTQYIYSSDNKPISSETIGGYPVNDVTGALYFYK